MNDHRLDFYPTIVEINDRLSVLEREQKRLRKLLRLAVQAKDDAERFSSLQIRDELQEYKDSDDDHLP